MDEQSITITKTENCPKCGSLCNNWKKLISHLWPKKRGRVVKLFEVDGVVKRKCPKCQETKVLSEFYSGWCKSCVKVNTAKRRKENPEKYRVYRNKYKKKWAKTIAGIASHKACKNRRKARLRGNGGKFTGTEFLALCERFGNRCLDCGVVGVDLTVDHVIPLSKGGSNGIENIQPLCHGCNVKKSDQTIDYRVLRVA